MLIVHCGRVLLLYQRDIYIMVQSSNDAGPHNSVRVVSLFPESALCGFMLQAQTVCLALEYVGIYIFIYTYHFLAIPFLKVLLSL